MLDQIYNKIYNKVR